MIKYLVLYETDMLLSAGVDFSIDSRSLVWWRTPAALTWLWIRTLLFSFTRFGWSLAAPLRSQTCFGTADFFFLIILQQFLALLHVWMNRVQLHIIQSGSMLPLLAPPCYWWKITYRGILSNRESEPSKPRHTHTHTYRCKMVWRTKETQMQWRRVVKIRTWIWQVCGPE